MWKQYRPAIQQGCVGCGLCVEVCPHPSKPIWIVKRTPETNEAVA
jgi:ferredoxin-type protein NapG